MSSSSTGTGSPATGPANTGIRAATSAYEALLSSDEEKQEPEEAAGEAEKGQPEAATETEEPEAEEAKGEEGEEAEQSEEQEEPEAPPAPETFTVRVDGTEVKVTKDELIAGYSRTSDYTRKTQQLAEQRKALEAEKAATSAERSEYGQLLPKLRGILEAGMGPEPDWTELRQKDPVRAAVIWQQREEMRRRAESLRAEETRVAAENAREQETLREQILTEERNKLLEKLPSWRDNNVASKERELIRQSMISAGFAEEELALYDHRAVVLALKAAKYDEMMSQKPKLDQKRSAAPVVKPGGGVPPKPKSEMQMAQARLKKSGSVKDAADVFAKFLG